MIHSRPQIFFNITPINPNGVTVVDLGSFPPSPTVKDSIEEMSDDSESVRVTDAPPQNLKTLSVQVNPAENRAGRSREGDNDSANEALQLVGPVTSTSNGVMWPRSSAGIKNEKTKTCWFFLSSESAISKPHTLHPDVTLGLGDLFINKFYSENHQKFALQIWLLVKPEVKGSNVFLWKQVVPDEITFHPELKDRILAFRPNDIPTWIKPTTYRSSRAMPLIVHGRG